MKAISKYFAMCAIALLGLANTSCMSDDMDGTPSCDYDVVLEYKVGGSATETRAAVTRAETTEVGSEDLNENKINRLDLFVFDGTTGKLDKRLTLTDVQGSPTKDYQHKKLESDQLKRSEITDKKLYLVANLDNISSSIKTLDDLKAATINKAATFNPYGQQTSFVMDAKMEESKQIVNGMIHIKFQLKRALAKIRLNVQDASGNTVAPTEYACQLMHYAADGAILAEDGAILAEGTCTNNALNTETAASSKVTAPAVTQDNKAVFYSYANSWIDKTKNPYAEEPIDVSKQTYILLKAKYNGKDYFYKVPVNKRLYESNDAATTDWTQYEPLYRLDRNTIYDVTAKVDRQGGDTPENPATLYVNPIVSDWDDNIAWDYTDKVSIEMEREAGEFGEAVEVHYGIPNGGGPAIKLNNIDTGDKNWILQCDNPDFAFYVDGKIYDTVSKSDINGNSFTFYVVPKRNKDLAVERNFDTKVFIVLAPDMRKVLFNVGTGKLPGDDFYIKFTQGADRSGN